ncbi:hypothetical protein DFQ26_009331 [Actinomortierella ambigua]|nr:hypothetical protein DFQ26_009331 [Actinomortierella ambigua]
MSAVARAAVDLNDPVIVACVRQCNITLANSWENSPLSTMKFSLASGLLLTVYGLATLMSPTEAGLAKCRDKCLLKLSKAAERCMKRHPIVDSEARFSCNGAQGERYDACTDRCYVPYKRCSKKCNLRLHTNWESCIDGWADPADPERIKCIYDVLHKSYNLCVAPCS